MTNNDSTTLIYKYHDKPTADIMVRWAEQYASDNNTSIDFAMVKVLLDIHNQGRIKGC